MRILHLANDDKFVDQAIDVFEVVKPNSNFLCVNSRPPYTYLRREPNKTLNFMDVFFGLDSGWLSSFDLVVVHFLSREFYATLIKSSKCTNTLWMGWGGDYYDLIGLGDVYGDKTKLYLRDESRKKKKNIFASASSLYFRILKNRVVGSLGFFSPVLASEYKEIKKKWRGATFPKYCEWNYGTLEDHLVKDMMQESVNGGDVLIGNSATPSNNHFEVLELLSADWLVGRKVFAPLSYGDPSYGGVVCDYGNSWLGNVFHPMVDFLSVDEYLKILKSCSYVIMNHVRQQALGNIVIMLYLGAKVFLNPKSPVYKEYKQRGIYLYSVDDISKDALSVPLSKFEAEFNRQVVLKEWGREASIERCRRLLAKFGE